MQQTLSLINKGLKEKKNKIKIPYSIKNLNLIKLLYEEGYLFNYKIWYNYIIIEFNIKEGIFICNGIKIYKKLNYSSYISYKILKKSVKKKNKRLIISTIYGICTSIKALRLGVGGLIIGEFI